MSLIINNFVSLIVLPYITCVKSVALAVISVIVQLNIVQKL